MKQRNLRHSPIPFFLLLMLYCSFVQAQGFREEEKVTFNFDKCSKIISTTEASLPTNKKRKELGVGEMVTLKLDNNKTAEWEIISGKASFDKVSNKLSSTGVEMQLYIRESIDDVVVSAKSEGSCSITPIKFEIFKPTEIFFLCPNEGPLALHRNGFPSAGITAKMFIFPDNVNFYNLEFQEQEKKVSTQSTYWLQPLVHKQGAWIECSAIVKKDFGTAISDDISDYISICGLTTFFPSNAGDDTSCDIPVLFRIKNLNILIPKTDISNLQETVTTSTGSTAVRKEGVKSKTFLLGYPISPNICNCTKNCWFQCADCCEIE